MPLPEIIVAGSTPGHGGFHQDIHRFVNRGHAYIDAMDPTYGVLRGGTDTSAALNAAYAAAKLANLPLLLRAGIYGYSSDLTWDSNIVGVVGVGSGAVTLQPIGTAKIVARPAVFTVTQGPTFRGFTIKGNATPNANGVYSGDITGSTWEDVIVQDFTGTGGVGFHVHNATNWTERNKFGLTLANNKIGLLLTVANTGVYSYEYNFFGPLRLNAFSGQTAIVSRGNSYVRGGDLNAVVNIDGTGIVMSIEDTSQWTLGVNLWGEGAGGAGGQGIVQAVGAYAFMDGSISLAGLPNAIAAPRGNSCLGGSVFVETATGKSWTPIHGFPRSAGSRPPTVGMLVGAGTSPPAAAVNATSDGMRGDFTVGTGTGPTAGQFCQVSFMDAAPVVPRVTLTARGYPSASAALQPYVFNETVFGFWVGVVGIPTASQANTTYGFSYLAVC